MKPKRFLILGDRGQLGRRMKALAIAAGHEVLDVDLDLYNQEQTIYRQVKRIAPDVLVNCAAKTDVDWCEDPENFKIAAHVNGLAVNALGMAMKEAKGLLVHVSSDMIFGANDFPPAPWDEDVSPHPVNKYGMSKYIGEASLARPKMGNILVVRVQHLWSSDRGLARMVFDRHRHLPGQPDPSELAAPESMTVSDSIIKPTSARLVCRDIMALINGGWVGTYHLGPTDATCPKAVVESVGDQLDLVLSEVKVVAHDVFFEGRARRQKRAQLKVQRANIACKELISRTGADHLNDIVTEIREDHFV